MVIFGEIATRTIRFTTNSSILGTNYKHILYIHVPMYYSIHFNHENLHNWNKFCYYYYYKIYEKLFKSFFRSRCASIVIYCFVAVVVCRYFECDVFESVVCKCFFSLSFFFTNYSLSQIYGNVFCCVRDICIGNWVAISNTPLNLYKNEIVFEMSNFFFIT